jgi:hypothetical protein
MAADRCRSGTYLRKTRSAAGFALGDNALEIVCCEGGHELDPRPSTVSPLVVRLIGFGGRGHSLDLPFDLLSLPRCGRVERKEKPP